MNSYYAKRFLAYCRNGDFRNVKRYMPKCREIITSQIFKACRWGFYVACKYEHVEIAHFIFQYRIDNDVYQDVVDERGINCNREAQVASQRGHDKIIEFLCRIYDGQLVLNIDWHACYIIACQKGYANIVRMLASKYRNQWCVGDFKYGILEACLCDCDDVIYILMDYTHDLNEGMYLACKQGSIRCINMLLDVHQHYSIDLNHALRGVCENGANCVVDSVVNYIQLHHIDVDWNEGLCGACFGQHFELVKRMLALGACNVGAAFSAIFNRNRPKLDIRIPVLLFNLGECELWKIWPCDVAAFLNGGIDVPMYAHLTSTIIQLKKTCESQKEILFAIRPMIPSDIIEIVVTYVGYQNEPILII